LKELLLIHRPGGGMVRSGKKKKRERREVKGNLREKEKFEWGGSGNKKNNKKRDQGTRKEKSTNPSRPL